MPGNIALRPADITRTTTEFLQVIARERSEQWTHPPLPAYKRRTRFTFLFLEVLIMYDTASLVYIHHFLC